MSIMSLVPLAEIDLLAAYPAFESKDWRWDVRGNTANIIQMDPKIILPTAKIVNALHQRGWKRGGHTTDFGFWEIYAYLRHGDAEARFTGLANNEDRPEGCTNKAVPFFAPGPPPLGRSKAILAAHEEWLNKCHRDEW